MIMEAQALGHSRKRIGIDGRPRYTAIYLDIARRERSAGTFATRRDADRAWQLAEAQLTAGRPGAAGGKSTLRDYVEHVWFPNHVLEPSTRQSYHYILHRHLFPTFGPMRMVDIQPAQVREWVRVQGELGQSPANIRQAKIVLSAVFTTALNDGIITNHPCKGVKTPTVPVKEYRILTPAEFDQLYAALPSAIGRLLVSTLIESGLRWGELSELRVRDLKPSSGIVTIARSVVEVNPRFHPDGERFAIKPYPKSRRARRFKLSGELITDLRAHIDLHRLGPDDLLFNYSFFNQPPRPTLTVVEDLGFTDPNAQGRTYRHGTLSGYGAGRCRCPHCKKAVAAYRATRRANGLDNPRSPRTRDSDGHIPAQWFRLTIWQPACTKATITPPVRLHDLRHSHASWLLAGGADLQVVKERLGHTSIATTEKYLHTLPDADDTALQALKRIRHQQPPSA